MTVKLLTVAERKALIDRLVEHDAKLYFGIAIGIDAGETGKIKKNIRRCYNTWDDAKLMSIKFKK